MTVPRVTVVIPVRDEAERLPACVEALAAQDLPPHQMEVLIVDGGSSDGTVELAQALLAAGAWHRAEVLHCEAGDRSSNLNTGLCHASAPILIRVDARSRVPAHYVRRCAELLESRVDVAVVGGRQRAVAPANSALAKGVARALNNKWGMGLARYRGAGSGSGRADTVYLGAYRTGELRAAGGWRSELTVNEDFDLNRRLAASGMVWFDADLAVDYVPRSSLHGLARQYWAFGLGKAHYWRVSGDRPQRRQAALLAAPVAVLGLLVGTLAVAGPAACMALVAAGAAVAFAIEVFGADGPATGLAGHLAAVAALGCVAGAWLAGIAAGTVLRSPGAEAAGTPPLERVG